MFCTNCGTRLPDIARFCPSCGTATALASPPAPSAAAPPPATAEVAAPPPVFAPVEASAPAPSFTPAPSPAPPATPTPAPAMTAPPVLTPQPAPPAMPPEPVEAPEAVSPWAQSPASTDIAAEPVVEDETGPDMEFPVAPPAPKADTTPEPPLAAPTPAPPAPPAALPSPPSIVEPVAPRAATPPLPPPPVPPVAMTPPPPAPPMPPAPTPPAPPEAVTPPPMPPAPAPPAPPVVQTPSFQPFEQMPAPVAEVDAAPVMAAQPPPPISTPPMQSMPPPQPAMSPLDTGAVQLACPRCGAIVPDGRKFCTACGFSLTGEPETGSLAPNPPSQPLPRTPPAGVTPALRQTIAAGSAPSTNPFTSMAPLELGILGGFLLAVIGTFLDWAKLSLGSFAGFEAGGISINGWNGDARFQLADWLSLDIPLDALLVLLAAVFGAFMVLAPKMGKVAPAIPFGSAIGGGIVILIGVLNYLFVSDLGIAVDPGLGLYLLIVGGGIAVACTFINEQKKV